MASSVEKRMALIFPVLILERLTLAIPTFSANSFKDIFRSALRGRVCKMIITSVTPLLSSFVAPLSERFITINQIEAGRFSLFPQKTTFFTAFRPILSAISRRIEKYRPPSKTRAPKQHSEINRISQKNLPVSQPRDTMPTMPPTIDHTNRT